MILGLLLGLLAGDALGATGSLERSAWRPVLSGPAQVTSSDDGFFHVHWTDEGADAVPTGEGVPPTVQRALDALVLGREAFEDRGWRPLVGDGGLAGTEGVDLYLRRVDINGYAYPVDIDEEGARGSCWMEVDSSLGNLSAPMLESVVVHELHHCVQYRYTWESHPWIYEATATWEQFRVVSDPGLDLGLGLLYGTRLSEPERPIDDLGGRFEYAGLLVMKHWWEIGGDGALLGLWEALGEDPDWHAALTAAAAADLGRDLEAHFLDHAAYNGFACARDDGAHYHPDVLPCVVDVSVPVEEVLPEAPIPVVHAGGPYTASYAEVAAAGDDRPVALACDPPEGGARLGVRLVALDRDGAAGEEAEAWAEAGEALDLRLDDPLQESGGVLMVFASTGEVPVDVTCTALRVAPLLPPEEPPPAACGCATGPGSAGWLLAGLAGVLLRRRETDARVETQDVPA